MQNVRSFNFAYILLAYAILISLSLIDNSRGPAYPTILKDFEIEPSQGSLVFSVSSLVGVFVTLFSRYWLGFLGAVGSARCSLGLIVLSSLLIGISGKLNQFSLLILASIILGVGLAFSSITMNVLIARGTEDKDRRRAFAGLHAIYGVFSFLAPQLLALAALFKLRWNDFFIIVAVIPFLFFLISIFSSRLVDTHRHLRTITSKIPLSKRLAIGLFIGLYVSGEVIISSRLPFYLEVVHGFSPLKSGYYLGLFFILLAAGRLVFAVKHFNLKERTLLFSSAIFSIILFFLGMEFHPIFLPLMGGSMSFFFPVSMDWMTGVCGKSSDYMIGSVMSSIGLYLTLVHYGFGFSVESLGPGVAIYCVPILLFFSIFVFALLKLKIE